MAFYDMLWVTEHPRPSTGKNTIRKLRSPYDEIMPGDMVKMNIVENPELDPYLVETLEVAAVATGNGWGILGMFAENNHGGDNPFVLTATMQELYGENCLSEEFIAITFK